MLRRAGYGLAGAAEPLCRRWRWLPVAVAVGAGPFALSYASGVGGHQAASAIALAFLCLACARTDCWVKGIATIAIAFAAHSALVILVAQADPQRAVLLLPDADAYWQKQVTWIQTGWDPEYEWKEWIPAQTQLLGGTILFSFTSWGVTAFYEGFYEVDLMNYYNAQLLARSQHRPLALLLGWHIWSVLRGLGYLFITYEALSLSLQLFSGVTLSTRAARRCRWSVGLALIVADGVVKLQLLEPVREQLFMNLR